MANFIKLTGLSARKFVNASSRYLDAKVYYYSDNKHLTFEIYKRKINIPSEDDQWLEITKPVEYRPDLVSTEIYGAPDFWWRILEYNGMKDILEFQAGKNIKLPGDILWQ